jgi:hypothetical protein
VKILMIITRIRIIATRIKIPAGVRDQTGEAKS